jgi:hypothetical protein
MNTESLVDKMKPLADKQAKIVELAKYYTLLELKSIKAGMVGLTDEENELLDGAIDYHRAYISLKLNEKIKPNE